MAESWVLSAIINDSTLIPTFLSLWPLIHGVTDTPWIAPSMLGDTVIEVNTSTYLIWYCICHNQSWDHFLNFANPGIWYDTSNHDAWQSDLPSMIKNQAYMTVCKLMVMSLLIRYAHIPFYFRFSFAFPTSPIHPYTPPLRHDRMRSRSRSLDNCTHSLRPISLIWWTYDLRFTCIYFYS